MIYYQNVRGLRTKTRECYLNIINNNYDIIIFTETWLCDSINNAEIFGNSYMVYKCNRSIVNSTKKIGGGVLVAVNIKFSSTLVNFSEVSINEEIWVKVSLGVKDLYIGGAYFPPLMPLQKYQSFSDKLVRVDNLVNVLDIVMVFGDFNLPMVNWTLNDDDNTLFATNVLNERDECIINATADCCLHQINFVRNINDRLLDLIFVNDFNSCSVGTVIDPLVKIDNHHIPVVVSIKYNGFKEVIKHNSLLEYNFKKANFHGLSAELSNVDWSIIEDIQDLDCAVNKFYQLLFSAFDHHVPKYVKKTSLNHPWYNNEIIQVKKRKDSLCKKLRKYGHSSLRYELKLLSIRFKNLNKTLHQRYLNSIQLNLRQNPKDFWNFVSSKRNNKGFPSTMFLRDKSATSPKNIAELFAEHFKSVYCEHLPDGLSLIDDYSNFQLGNIIITEENILESIGKSKVVKCTGPDGVPQSVLKNCGFELVRPLAFLFNKSLNLGVFPKIWKDSFLTPVYKASDRNNVENYRGIAVLSSIPKHFESIICDHLSAFVKTRISSQQHGFFKGRSVQSNLLKLTNEIFTCFENRGQMDVVYTDFSKAFDRICHAILLKKLTSFGIHSSVLGWIFSYLTNRKIIVKIEGWLSDGIFPSSGVPQGSHLGPILFLIYINDIVRVFKYASCLLFADDLKLYMQINNNEDYDRFQEDINSLWTWCLVNKLDLNISKCDVMSFS